MAGRARSGSCCGSILGVAVDVRADVAAKGKNLLYYALHDPLTGLPNRSSLLEQAESALGQAARESSSIAVLLVDLDDFEEVNHGLGDEAGDRLLTIVGKRLQASVRPGGFVARPCGDEFAILLEDVADRGSAVSAARRIEETLGAPIELNGSEVLVSASVGVAIGGPEQEDGPEDLLRNADVAMHAAKRKGKARFRCSTLTPVAPLLDAR